jgi:proteasome lid subunit RPN8/RPN11
MSQNPAKKQQASAQLAVVSAAEVTALTPAEPKVNIDSEVTRRIRQHARAHFKTEVCGVLIGESTDTEIDICASIEALTATQAGTHVTFTQDAWEEIYKVKDERYPEARIVGWYHSHPGFGIFLSEHDLFIQENFFSSPGQVAWVYDPHSDEEGCFGWVGGRVARLGSVAVAYRGGEAVEHASSSYEMTASSEENEDAERDPWNSARSGVRAAKSSAFPAWVRWTQLVLSHLTVLAAGFAASYFLYPHMLAVFPNPATGEVLIFDYQQFRSYLQGTGPAPRPVDELSLTGASQAAPAAPSATPPPSTPQSPAPLSNSSTKPATQPPAAQPATQGSKK